MPRQLPTVAIAYDFDGTLAPGNMQEHNFIPNVRMSTSRFWRKVKEVAKQHQADEIQVYMHLMIQKARDENVSLRLADIRRYGRNLKLFEGVESWFERINRYGRESGIRIEHYVISSGLREMVQGTRVAKHFKRVFASSFMYDNNNAASWPAMALNYTTKTQFLFRINKGSLDVFDHTKINEYVPQEERAVPFSRMVFIGDGETDIPCFRLVRDQGGHAIAVYRPHSRKTKKRSEKLIEDGRVQFVAPADYRDGRNLDRILKGIIDKIAADEYLKALSALK